MNEENMEDRIDDITTTSFSIVGVPVRVFKRFLKFCENNSKITKVWYDKDNNKKIKEELCYSIALTQLLDIADADAKIQLLYDRITALEDKCDDPETVTKKSSGSFGIGKPNKDKKIVVKEK